MDIKDVIFEIKRKKELFEISEKFLENFIKRELQKREYLLDIIKRSKNIKDLKRDPLFIEFFKEIRKILHEIYGVFTPKDRKRMLDIIYSDLPLKQKIIELLTITQSTRERINFYSDIYKNIFIEDPIEILDLASGLNPISIYFSDKKPERYDFLDISKYVIQIVDYILNEIGIKNNGYEEDIFNLPKEILKNYQYIFIWKTIPLLEKVQPGYTKELINILDFDYLVISFPRRSLRKRKEIGKAWIPWIKKIAKDLNLEIKKEYEIPNEYFIILSKKK